MDHPLDIPVDFFSTPRALFGISVMAGMLICVLFLIPLTGYFFRRFHLGPLEFPEGNSRILWLGMTFVFVLGGFVCGMELLYMAVCSPQGG